MPKVGSQRLSLDDHRRHRLLGAERMAGQAQAQLGAADVEIEVAAAVGDRGAAAAGDALAADADAVLRLAGADDDLRRRAVDAVDEVERRVVGGDVRVAEDDGVVEGAADRDRPVLDAPRLADQAVAVDHLEQRQRRG